MRFINYFLLLIFFSSFVTSTCSSNQIDLNNAPLAELDKLIGIGPVKAQAIIDSRPFSAVDDLIDVYGIGEATLEKIKQQNMACVETEKTTTEKEEDLEETESNTSSKETEFTSPSVETSEETKDSSESIINLNNELKKETIVYESKNEKINKNLLVGFCVFIVGLIFLLTKK